MSEARRRAAERLRLALDMYEAGEAMLRSSLARRFPTDDADALERRIRAWLRDRPGAGDGPDLRLVDERSCGRGKDLLAELASIRHAAGR